MRRLGPILLGSALFVLLHGAAAGGGDQDDINRTRQRHNVVEEYKKSGSAEGARSRIKGLDDASTGTLAAIDCVLWAYDRLGDSIARRDAQGRELYAYYKAHYATRSEPSDKEVRTYEAMAAKNHEACVAVAQCEGELETVAEALGECGRRTFADGAGPPLADAVRATLRPVRASGARARVFEQLGGPCVEALATDLEKAALKGETREERVAALRCLAHLGPKVHVDVLRPCVEDEDPYVRRAAFPLMAAAGTREAVDALVGRMARETGVPGYELATTLVKLTGRQLGDVGKAWTEWWAGAREGWEGPPAADGSIPPLKRRDGTRYFGLTIESMRVLFVVDRSWSMECGIGYDGKDDLTLFTGEQKIEVARRELTQAVKGLADGASFNIVAFGSSTKHFGQRLADATPDNRKRAASWIESLELDGNTNLGGALIEAFASLAPSARAKDAEIADTIVVMTDGVPNCGPIADEEDVLAEIRRLNRDHSVTIHAVYLGIEGNISFMQRLASENGGQFVHHKDKK
jgi:VWA domain-containing protein/HEAT repeat protein